jgi:hypothetical protein
MAFAGLVVVPCAWVCQEGSGVEQVSEKSGGEESGGEPRGRLADLVHVELGKAGAEVEERGEPGEDFAGDFGGGGRSVRSRDM